MSVEKQRTGLKLGSCFEPALELPLWKRGNVQYHQVLNIHLASLHCCTRTIHVDTKVRLQADGVRGHPQTLLMTKTTSCRHSAYTVAECGWLNYTLDFMIKNTIKYLLLARIRATKTSKDKEIYEACWTLNSMPVTIAHTLALCTKNTGNEQTSHSSAQCRTWSNGSAPNTKTITSPPQIIPKQRPIVKE